MTDRDEVLYGAEPKLRDSDGDGVSDVEETSDDQQFEDAFNTNILVRERFEQSGAEGASSPTHAAELQSFQDDMFKALIDRDPKAFERASIALGKHPTAEEIKQFVTPSPSDVVSAGRQAELMGVEIPETSALAVQMIAVSGHMQPGTVRPTRTIGPDPDPKDASPERVAEIEKFRDDLHAANVDRDPEALVRAREYLGMETTPADLDHFENPSAEEVADLGRHLVLLGDTVPDDSALSAKINDLLGPMMPGAHAAPSTSGPPTGSSTPGGTSTAGPASSNNDSTDAPADRNDVPANPPAAGGAPHSTPAAETPTGSPGATSTSPGEQPTAAAPPSSGTSAPAATPGTEHETETTTSRGTEPTTAGLGMPGGVGTKPSSVGGGGGGGGGPKGEVVESEEFEAEEIPAGTLGYIWVDDGHGGKIAIDPNTNEPVAHANPPQSSTGGSENPNAGTTDDDGEREEEEEEEESEAEGEGEEGEEGEGEDDDEEDEEGEADEGEEASAMTDPDAAGATGALVAGIATPTGAVVPRQSGFTDGGRDDADNGLGPISGEVVGKLPMEPRVDPDHEAGGHVDPYHSGTGIGTVDGVNPDLVNTAGAGPVGPPPDGGVNPVAAGHGDDFGFSSSAATASSDESGFDITGVSVVDSNHSVGGIQTVDDNASSAAETSHALDSMADAPDLDAGDQFQMPDDVSRAMFDDPVAAAMPDSGPELDDDAGPMHSHHEMDNEGEPDGPDLDDGW